MLKIILVVGARPNFPKVAPIMLEMAKHPHRLRQVLVHTGQHYDYDMSRVFFEDLEMPPPDELLSVGSGSHAVQTAKVMTAFETAAVKHRPDAVVVVGDVNSTLACALVCSKLGVPVAHVEAGLRSRDRTMPEEINRLLTDQLSEMLFTPSRDASDNLLAEGIAPARIHFVGNVMIDTVVRVLPKARQRPVLKDLGLGERGFLLATLHRPSNVDDPAALRAIIEGLVTVSRDTQVIFPVHPRTRSRIQALGVKLPNSSLRLMPPFGYLDFLALMSTASLVVTDSGGVQEETTFLGVQCLTVRPNTERPVTITEGTNRLVGSGYDELVKGIRQSLSLGHGVRPPPELWDGHAASRIVKSFLDR
jgi:UDP-N-acetylglucosamine 2-epimerase (non-hydrolysing)